MSPVKARRREIVVEEMRLKAREAVEMILGALPHVAIEIVEPFRVGRIKIDGLWEKIFTRVI